VQSKWADDVKKDGNGKLKLKLGSADMGTINYDLNGEKLKFSGGSGIIGDTLNGETFTKKK
jgi:hypothetical protein